MDGPGSDIVERIADIIAGIAEAIGEAAEFILDLFGLL